MLVLLAVHSDAKVEVSNEPRTAADLAAVEYAVRQVKCKKFTEASATLLAQGLAWRRQDWFWIIDDISADTLMSPKSSKRSSNRAESSSPTSLTYPTNRNGRLADLVHLWSEAVTTLEDGNANLTTEKKMTILYDSDQPPEPDLQVGAFRSTNRNDQEQKTASRRPLTDQEGSEEKKVEVGLELLCL